MWRKVLDRLESLGEYTRLIFEVIWAGLKHPPRWKVIQEQLYNIGVLSLPVVAITGFSTGTVLAAQSFYQLSNKGFAGITGIMVAKAMITELGPVLTALMVTGRVGSSMCAEIGTMRVTEQIDALKSMAVNPSSYLIAPRFIAGFVMVPLLTIFSIIMGIIGGYIIACLFFGMPAIDFFVPMAQHINLFDIFTGIFKASIFAILLTTICCYQGLKTRGGAAGVGKATTKSVVISYVSILVVDFFLTIALNAIHKELIIDTFS